jgi:hypothetical protein
LKDKDIEDLTIDYAGVPHNHILEAMDIIQQFFEDVDLEYKT